MIGGVVGYRNSGNAGLRKTMKTSENHSKISANFIISLTHFG